MTQILYYYGLKILTTCYAAFFPIVQENMTVANFIFI